MTYYINKLSCLKIEKKIFLVRVTCILYIRKFSRGYYFRETSHSHMRSFVNIKSSQNGKITLSFTDIVMSCTSCEFLKFSLKFPDLQ